MIESPTTGEFGDETKGVKSALYLTFRIDNELLAFDVSQVREVLDLSPITKVPRSPEFMRGVINLRGSVIPVFDLRISFDLSRIDATIDSRIVVVELARNGTEAVVGLLIESVHDVIEIGPDKIDASPQMAARWRTEYISGIGKFEDQHILLLDIDRVFTVKEMLVHSESQTGSDNTI